MNQPAYRAQLQARIWQALAQTDVDLSTLSKESQATLVDTVTTAALLEVDNILGEVLAATPPPEAEVTGPPIVAASKLVDPMDPDPLKEDILWEGRPFLSIMTRYLITDERIRIIEGLLGKTREDVELIRVQDISQSQSVSERMLSLGDLTIRSHDRGNPIIVLRNIPEPEKVHEILRRALLNARKKHNFSYREEM